MSNVVKVLVQKVSKSDGRGDKVSVWQENLRLDDTVRCHLSKESLGAFSFVVFALSPDLTRENC